MKQWVCGLALALALAGLTGCAGATGPEESQLEAIREQYRALEEFSAEATVATDCEGRIYEYQAAFSGTLTSGAMTVTAPEELAGCSITWDENGLVLDWEQVELDTGTLNQDGLTPVDAMAAILTCCTEGLLVECSQEAEGTELYAELENPKSAGCTAQCWFDSESGALKRADLTSGGKTLVTLAFSTFTMTTKAGDEPGQSGGGESS